ncbi:MAG: hypothetical protein AAGI53_17410 [Planctomycetota bacterium]
MIKSTNRDSRKRISVLHSVFSGPGSATSRAFSDEAHPEQELLRFVEKGLIEVTDARAAAFGA